jgi:hypothetical protein
MQLKTALEKATDAADAVNANCENAVWKALTSPTFRCFRSFVDE